MRPGRPESTAEHFRAGPAGLGLIVILDSKRNDIAATATAYAEAILGGVSIDGIRLPVWPADAMTINPYLGRDAVEPFLHCARQSRAASLCWCARRSPAPVCFRTSPAAQGLSISTWARPSATLGG